MKTIDAARNKWKGILLALGVPDEFLTGKHGPCPFCGGKDRFRFDNKGEGSFYCSQCGAGKGFDFLLRLKGWDFKRAANEIDQVIGNVSAEQARPAMAPERRRAMLNTLWMGGAPVREGDAVASYLAGRDLPLPASLGCLRFSSSCPVPDSPLKLPAMLALVTGLDGKPVNIHRTFLGPNGKADIDKPRAMMPGDLPAGSAVRLAPHGEKLGIAEGIETALGAAKRFQIPVWAAINSTLMAKWLPPEGVTEVYIFGDNDPKFGGAAAAYELAHRLAVKDIFVRVQIPRQLGLDWADREAA
ncbi:DUF7146 domain-containing protein [Sphingomonas crocodyli]|uniref:P4 alpha zinc-binding domain protein n=1 Tax=Sphingomonas crocodyli TaxID=1979270 RepID=A0A437M7X1_9SPHN|nr:toprim domain-containing protein [Sphingomonas crocodyli]RVT93713.1 P4 alpha zinc-binding domain protein [Sphingomonas crocodyli]